MKRKAQLLARESWNVIREVASIWTLARRATTDEFVFNCLKIGSKQATQAILDSGVLLRPKKSKQVKKKQVSGSSKKQRVPKEDHLAFFLTEFDNNDENSLEGANETGSEGEEGSEDEGKTSGSHCESESWASFSLSFAYFIVYPLPQLYHTHILFLLFLSIT